MVHDDSPYSPIVPMSALPKVSLVMPAFIRDEVNLRYFNEALQSALAQTYRNLEILVIDDGSPLSGPLDQLVDSYRDKVRYVKKANGGVASALNVALAEMTGDYFTWLSHDDLYLPGKVETQMSQMAREPEGVILYCDVEHVDSDAGHLFLEESPEFEPDRCRVFIAHYGAPNANAHLIPRKCFDAVGRFDEGLRTTQDNQMWYRLSEHFVFKRVPKVLIKYRNHPTQDSRSPIHLRECNELFIYFLENLRREDIVRHAGVSPARYYAECACLRRRRGYAAADRDALRRATGEFLGHPLKEWSNLNLITGLWLGQTNLGREMVERIQDGGSGQSRPGSANA